MGPYENNAYLLRDPETNDALLVDAANEAERLLELLDGVTLVGIVTTATPTTSRPWPGCSRSTTSGTAPTGPTPTPSPTRSASPPTGCWSTATP